MNILIRLLTASLIGNVVSGEERRVFDDVLRAKKRLKVKAVNSFHNQPDDVLNLLTKEHWIEPKPGQYDEIFDVVLDSLSDGRKNVRDHIEQVLVYKYLHPECYSLPCITISGQGGACKNVFVEQVLRTIFGESQVITLGSESAFGQFNGPMLGKTVVFIDDEVIHVNLIGKTERYGDPIRYAQ